MGKAVLEVVFGGTVKVVDVWQRLHDNFCLGEQLSLYGLPSTSAKVLAAIKKKGQSGFLVASGASEVRCLFNAHFKHVLLQVSSPDEACYVRIVEAAAAAFGDDVIQAFVIDADYALWQNATSIEELKANGMKPPPGAKLVSNGLPPPLDAKVLDTNKNPGRRILREGYVETVAGTMWIGRRLPTVKDQQQLLIRLKAEKDIAVVEESFGLLKVVCSTSIFRDESTKRIQERLREIIFGG